jgi:redox-sensitive bicupin YhaK (pirin superfamily)
MINQLNMDNNFKKITGVKSFAFKQAFPGLRGIDIFAHQYPIEPFLVFTEYYMNKPVFGPHPHAGISVLTFMLPDSKESFINRDSNGDFSTIEPGGLHITQAGSGIHHDEFPTGNGHEAHGFQIWINHAEKDRMVVPKAIHASADQVKEVHTPDATVRILHGAFQHNRTDYQLKTDVNLLHVLVKPNRSIILDAKEMAFVYTLTGLGAIDDVNLTKHQLINFSEAGNAVKISAGAEGFSFMFASAKPLNEPIVYGGPFVMTTTEQMNETKRNYASGKMGELAPYHI